MPIASKIRIKHLLEFVEQIKVAPERVRQRQMDACELLVHEIQADHLYPLDYVIFRITGYRIDPTSQPMLLGEPLRSDLVSMVAVISRTLNLQAAGMLEVEEVAELYGVSNRTISRLRKEGLVFHWVVEDEGRCRIGCNRQTAEIFLAEHHRRLHSASAFSQLTSYEQETIIDAAMQYSGSGMTLNALATELAKTNHRGLETIRLLLQNSERAEVSFKHRPPLSRQDAREIQRELATGTSWKTLQQRYARTPAAIRRAIVRMRATDLKADMIPFMELPSFSQKDASEAILGLEIVQKTTPPQLSITVDEASSTPPLSTSDEVAFLAAMHMLNFRASSSIGSLCYSPTNAMVDRIETDLRWSFVLHQQLVLSALSAGLAVFVQHVGRPLMELPLQQSIEITRRAIALIWDTVSTIDPSRGQKVGKVVVAHIDRMLSTERSLARPRRASARRQTASLSFPFSGAVTWSRLLPEITPDEISDACPDKRREMYAMRFGWMGHPKTIQQIATQLGCSELSVVRKLNKW